jgi:hypothetical protein
MDCLEVIRQNLLQPDICNVQRPGVLTSEISKQDVEKHIKPHVQYACRFWVAHYQQSCPDNGCDSDIESFLRNRFLYWLEVMALLNRVSDGIAALSIIESKLWVRFFDLKVYRTS